MNSRRLAGIFILAVVSLAIFANHLKNMKNENKILKVAIPGEFPEGQLSPENISTVALFHLHYNVWDTLLTSNQSAAVAKSFRISPDNLSLTFEIDPEAKFSNGRAITAIDVKAAFERLMAREEIGHINAKSIIRKITAASPSELKIELSAPTPAFLFLLTTPEFGIVPKEALDSSGNVTNLSVTSGAYTVKNVDSKAQIMHLSRNNFFRRAVKNSPAEIELSYLKEIGANSDPEKLFRYDFVEVRSSDSEKIVSEAKKKDLSYRATVPSVSIFMVEDTNHVSPEQARFIAQAFRDHFQFETPHGLEKRSNQFFPEKTFGSLSSQEIPGIPTSKSPPAMPAEIVISGSRSDGPLVEAVAAVFAKIGVKARFVGLDSKEPIHYMLTGQGMNTDFPEIELHLDTVGPYADFNATEEIKRLVKLATHEPNETKRAEFIKSIGKEFLSSGKIVPLTIRAYVHIYNSARVDLNNITNYDGDIPLYKLTVPE